MTKIARESRLNDKPQPARPIAPLILGMRADFRRSALYVPIGILPFAAAHWWFRDWFPPTGNSPVVSLIALAALVLLPVAVFRWRLRVDSSGIARRRLFGWDLWPWQLFEQGKVLEAEASPATFILPVKPFWARTLSLNLLEDSDRARVEAIIDRFHVRPALDLPEELALRCAFRKEAVITRGGLLLRDRGVETRYRWKETQALRIRRRDHRRRNFETLNIVLPDRTVTFSTRRDKGNLIRSWSATSGSATPTAEVLAAVIERSIPRERIQIDCGSASRPFCHDPGRPDKLVAQIVLSEFALPLRHSSNHHVGTPPDD